MAMGRRWQRRRRSWLGGWADLRGGLDLRGPALGLLAEVLGRRRHVLGLVGRPQRELLEGAVLGQVLDDHLPGGEVAGREVGELGAAKWWPTA